MAPSRISKGYDSEAVATLNGSFNFFSGRYFSGVSLGANLKGAFRLVSHFADSRDQDRCSGSLVFVPERGFEPAAEGLSLIARSQALMERIDEMQSLDF
jgi:hypothetical protein